MKTRLHIIFWALVYTVFTLYFGNQYANYHKAFYFVSMLLPVVIGTCYFFNLYLVPQYLLRGMYFKFGLYTLYMIVVSLYLEMVVITLSFIFLAEYSYNNMAPATTDVFALAISLYFVVLLCSFFTLVRRSFAHEQTITALEDEKNKYEVGSFTIRSSRKMVTLTYEEVVFIESLADYVKVHQPNGECLMTKEKISSLEKRLPDCFIRTHRSFLINKQHISTFNKEEVELTNGIVLPISRTYKNKAWEALVADSG